MIRMATIQTRECIEGDAGEVARGFYFVTGDILKMCSEDGRPTGKTYKLNAADDERVVATRLLRQEMLKQPASDFNRTIAYQRSGIA